LAVRIVAEQGGRGLRRFILVMGWHGDVLAISPACPAPMGREGPAEKRYRAFKKIPVPVFIELLRNNLKKWCYFRPIDYLVIFLAKEK